MDVLHTALLPGVAVEIGVTLLIKGSLLIGFTWVLARVARGTSAATRYAVWMAGLVGAPPNEIRVTLDVSKRSRSG